MADRTPAHQALVRFCTDYLAAQHAWVYKTWGGFYSRPGIPDILAALRDARSGYATLVCVECKSGAGRLSGVQQRERAALEAVGAVYLLVRTPEELEAGLVAAGLCAPILVGRG
jgi:hypothetical protein